MGSGGFGKNNDENGKMIIFNTCIKNINFEYLDLKVIDFSASDNIPNQDISVKLSENIIENAAERLDIAKSEISSKDKYDYIVINNSVDEAVKEITTICNDIGPRKSGSNEELKAQEHMAKYIQDSCNKTEISKEIFFCTKNAKVIYDERDSENII